MKIAICETKAGKGNFLKERLINEGYKIAYISREDFASGIIHLKNLLQDIDVVINLCGNEIVKKWTPFHKERIYTSHVEKTRMLVKAINSLEHAPSLFITFTMVNIYNNIAVHDEYSQDYATDFLGDFCRKWEKEILKINSEIRTCILRTGFILSDKKGYLPLILKYYNWGFGKKIGDGKQPFPYIHIDDVENVVAWCIKNSKTKGFYNLVAPEIVTNAEFYATLSKVLKRHAFFRISKKLITMKLGEASEIFISGKCVVPHHLLLDGYQFIYPTLNEGLENILKE